MKRSFSIAYKWTQHCWCFFFMLVIHDDPCKFVIVNFQRKEKRKKKCFREKLDFVNCIFLRKGNCSEKISINQALNFDLIGSFLGCLHAQSTFHVIYINVQNLPTKMYTHTYTQLKCSFVCKYNQCTIAMGQFYGLVRCV